MDDSLACPQCQQTAGLLFRTTDRNRRISDEVFTYYRCPSCGLIFLSPIPDNLSDYYFDEYYMIPDSLDELIKQTRPHRYKIDIVQQLNPEGRLLEVGPATGGFAYLAKQVGYHVDTIELDADSCRFLTEVVGVRAINSGDVVDALQRLDMYNVIALWHVFEHLPEPWLALDALVDHLAPGGILVIAAPNPAAFQFRIFGRWWTHVDAPRHVQLVPISVLIQRMAERGITPALTTTRDPGSLEWNIFGWQMSLQNFFARHTPRRFMRAAGLVASKLFGPIERSDLRGSTYTLVFKK